VEADGHRILLNGSPIALRGVLHWGHEPHRVAPAPTPEQVRREFRQLRDMGLNTVCLCMWYAPEHFYDIADETGMLLWQVQPVWQSPMDEADLPEYRRLYESFMRRDARHPSVVVVSATCEHPSFHPALAAWWWDTARRRLPDRLLQLQTAFFRWADPGRTDLHDEHTYDNSNRWVSYLQDVQEHLDTLPPRPFVMGETALFTSWPDVGGLAQRLGGRRPWWVPCTLEHQRRLEGQWSARFGPETVERFRRGGDRFNLLNRKFQVEQFRRYPRHAGLVMNHLRDVPRCQCGLMDDLERWRFAPDECRGWLGDVALLLDTPAQRRAFAAPVDRSRLDIALLVRNDGPREVAGHLEWTMRIDGAETAGRTGRLVCPPGAIRSRTAALALPEVDRPTPARLEATLPGVVGNAWDLWLFPAPHDWPRQAVRLSAIGFDRADAEPDPLERCYSRGYGLPARRWCLLLPDPARLAPNLQAWPHGEPPPADVATVLTHTLTPAVLDLLEGGGRVVLLTSRTAGGLGARYESLYGAVPLVPERWPLHDGDSAWVVDLLGYDLMRRAGRVIPTELFADEIEPIVRMVSTHDERSRARMLDLAFQTRVARGLLIASSLDHFEAAGQHLLRLFLDETHAAEDWTDKRLERSALEDRIHHRGAEDTEVG
jgi:hypothetical protein